MSLSIEEIQKLLDKNSKTPQKIVDNFDPAALFLLTLLPDNLFEPFDRYSWKFRCKGCGDIVISTDRNFHFSEHKRLIHGK